MNAGRTKELSLRRDAERGVLLDLGEAARQRIAFGIGERRGTRYDQIDAETV